MPARRKVSDTQLQVLFKWFEDHPHQVKATVGPAYMKEENLRQWEDVVSQLNSVGDGVSKTVQQWRQYWSDLKVKARTRTANRRRNYANNESFSQVEEEICAKDKKILAIIGEDGLLEDRQQHMPFSYEVIASEASPTAGVSNIILLDRPDGFKEISASDESNPDTGERSSEHHQTDSPPGSRHAWKVESSKRVRTPASASKRQTGQPPGLNITNGRNDSVCAPNQETLDTDKKIVDAVMMMSEAARIQAEAQRTQAEAARIQAEAARTQADTVRMQLELIKQLLQK